MIYTALRALEKYLERVLQYEQNTFFFTSQLPEGLRKDWLDYKNVTLSTEARMISLCSILKSPDVKRFFIKNELMDDETITHAVQFLEAQLQENNAPVSNVPVSEEPPHKKKKF